MSYRIQFTISDEEYNQLLEQVDEGYANVSELCKTRALKGKNTYAELYTEMVAKIKEMLPGTEFYLRDIIGTPPALLGRWLFDNVENGKIENVEHLGNDGTNPERYRKIKLKEN